MRLNWRWIATLGVAAALACQGGAEPAETDLGTAEAMVSAGGTNVALAANHTVASASSSAVGTSAAAVIDGDRSANSVWRDSKAFTFPDVVTVQFARPAIIDEIDVFAVSDRTSSSATQYTVQYQTDGFTSPLTWTTLAQMTPTGLVGSLTFPPVTASAIRVIITAGGSSGFSQLAEIEAWTVKPCSTCTPTSSCASTNRCLLNGTVSTCLAAGVCDKGQCSATCDPLVSTCTTPCTAGGNLPTTCGAMRFPCLSLASCASTCTAASACYTPCERDYRSSTCATQVCNTKPALKGLVSNFYQQDVNRCVVDPVGQVADLPMDGIVAGYSFPSSFPQTSSLRGNHWQTIVRLPIEPNRFVLALNQETEPYYSGFFAVINSASATAEMMQQNDASLSSNRYNHPGGAQALGTGYLFVAEEQNQANIDARVRIYHQQWVAAGLMGVNPWGTELPTVSTFTLNPRVRADGSIDPTGVENSKGAAAVAVAKLQPLPGETKSRYLMMVASANYSYQIMYWLSQPVTAVEQATWGHMNYMTLARPEGGKDQPYLAGWGPQQNMNLLTDCMTGQLYLISWGYDRLVRLHRLDLYFNVPMNRAQATPGAFAEGTIGLGSEAAAVRKVNYGYFYDPAETKPILVWDSFEGAAGTYVTSSGALEVYGTSKYSSLYTTKF